MARKLEWSQNGQGNWNGKGGPYTLMVVAFHEGEGWWLHSKLPGLSSQKVNNDLEGRDLADRLFLGWLHMTGV